MAFDPRNILIAGTGELNVAPELTTLPTTLDGTLDPAFVGVGYSTEDGAKFTDSKSTNAVRPWQSFYPVRYHVTERDAMIETTLLEWNSATTLLAFGGGEITEVNPGEFTYTPPPPETIDVRAVVLDIVDGAVRYRWCIARAFVTSNTESDFAKTGPALLPVTLMAMANGDEDPWFFITNAENMAPVGS